MKAFGFIIWTAFVFFLGVVLSNERGKHTTQCFESCAALVLLTPDDADIYKELLQDVEECAQDY